MTDLMVDLFKNYDKIIVGVASAFAPVILALIAYWRLKRLGINKYNIAEIADRAKFRQDLLSRVRHVESALQASQEREASLQRENGEQAAQIEAMTQDIRELKVERRNLKSEVRDLRRKIHILIQGLPKAAT